MSSSRPESCKVAIIGAGPYGLSVAAHLEHAGISTRAFGEPMAFWRHYMPKGMKLRSPWRATHISDADRLFSLDAYASEIGLDPAKLLSLEDFVAYGQWFQAHAVPEVDRRTVRRIELASSGFQLDLDDGTTFAADRVVVATGLANQEYRPPAFRALPSALVTHTCEHADFAQFHGQRIAVIGRGQSACESAVLLAEAGADVELFTRGDIHWLGNATSAAVTHKTPFRRARDLLAAPSAVGPFPLSWLVELPGAVRRLPSELRAEFTRRCLKAGAAGWLKPRFAGVRYNPGRMITVARALSNQIVLDHDNGPTSFDHVLLGTGYRIDVSRIGILSPRILAKIACREGSPLLDSGFQSSVPKLHFVGSHAVESFGPLLRFIAGARFAARSVTRAALAPAAQDATHESSKAVAQFPDRAAHNLSPPT